ncbi:MAG: hypothetical protein AB1445_08875 [Bacillota bacterium]
MSPGVTNVTKEGHTGAGVTGFDVVWVLGVTGNHPGATLEDVIKGAGFLTGIP